MKTHALNCNYHIDPGRIGGDPAHGCGKTYDVWYQCTKEPTKHIRIPPDASHKWVRIRCQRPPPSE